MRARSLVVLALVASGADALRTVSSNRRQAVAAAAAAALTPAVVLAVPPTFVSGKQRQGLGVFTKKFDRAVVAGDVGAVRDALALFDLNVDEDAAKAAITPSGGAAGHQPVIVSTTTGLASTKVTMRVPDAVMEKDNFIKLLWLRNADTGDVICCRELTKLSEVPEMVQASVAKGIRVEPVAYCNVAGVWVGEAVAT